MSLLKRSPEQVPVPHARHIPLNEVLEDSTGPGTYDEKYLDSAMPVAATDLIRERGPQLSRDNPVLGYTQLAPAPEAIQHFGSCDLMTLISKGLHPENLHSGRVAKVTATTTNAIPGGGEKTGYEVLSVMDLDWAKGDIYRRWVTKLANEHGIDTPLARMRSAFALFAYDSKAAFPLPNEEGKHADLGDWRLVDTLTDVDACPENALIIKVVQARDRQGNLKYTDAGEPVPRYKPTLLSKEASKYDGALRSKYRSTKDYESVLEGVINALHKMYDVRNPKEYKPGYNYERAAHHPNPVLNRDIKQLIQLYEQHCPEDSFALRIPAQRAYDELQQLKEIEQSNPNIPALERERNQSRRSAIYHEVSQAIAMIKAEHSIKEEAKIGLSEEQRQAGYTVLDPVRWRIKVLNNADITFARNLPKITGQYSRDDAFEIADYFDGYDNAHLLITATENNEVRYGKTLKDDSGENGDFAIDNRTTMPFGNVAVTSEGEEILDGDFVREKIRSLHDDKPLRLGGMVCKLEAQADDLTTHSMPVLVVNLLEAPGKLLRQIHEMGHFENTRSVLPEDPTLTEMLTRKNPSPTFVIADVADMKNPVIKEGLREGDAAQFAVKAIRRNIREIRIMRTKVYSELEIAKKGKKPVKREDRNELGNRYSVIPAEIREDEVAIAGITVCRGTLHVRENQAAHKLGAQLAVMRSKARPRQPQFAGRR